MEVGVYTLTAIATPVTEEPQRSELFAKRAAVNPGFADYEQNTAHKIPMLVLTPTTGATSN